MYMANRDTEEAKELEHKLTQEIGDQEEYCDAEPQLFKLIEKLENEDLWQLVRLAELIYSGESVPETTQFPRYELAQYGENNEVKMVVQEANGVEDSFYGHTCVLNQLIACDFVKVK